MGHIRLGRLPRHPRWKRVIELLSARADVAEIAQASLHAAESGLLSAPRDEGFVRTLTTVFDFINAVQSKDVSATLRAKGFPLTDEPTLLDFSSAFARRVDALTFSLQSKTDLPEIAKHSFNQVLLQNTTPLLPSLFETGIEQVESALRTALKGRQLKETMHEFFATFTHKYLQYYLSREMSNHVGIGRALANTDDHTEFKRAFETYVRQTVRITDEFTPGWFGKARFEQRLSKQDVSRYAHVAFKKIRSEFHQGAEPNG